MGLDRETKNCQDVEAYDDCKTKSYVENLRQECGCLPLALRLSEKVKFNEWMKQNFQMNISGYFMHDKWRSQV